MKYTVLAAAFYVLGALGLFAIGAIPLRGWWHWRMRPDRLWRLCVSGIVLLAVALAHIPLLSVGRCLLGEPCSGSVAGGWLNAAAIGVIYLGFELTFAVLRLVHRRRSH